MPIAIKFNQKLKYFGLQRHFSRGRDPKPGNIWDWDAPLAENASSIANHMRTAYFRGITPKLVMASRVPRAQETARLMWPQVSNVVVENALGPGKETISEWAPIENLPVTASGEDIYVAAPKLVERIGLECFSTLFAAMTWKLNPGEMLWAVSHCPYTDVVMRGLREAHNYAIPTGYGWLPGQFGSGAFLLAGYDESGNIAEFEYYPALKP